MAKKRGFINIILLVAIIFVLLSAGAYFVVSQQIFNPLPEPTPNPTVCTQEAKQCPDGSYVGRTGSNCEFTECPIINPVSQSNECSKVVCGTNQIKVANKCSTNLEPICYCSCENLQQNEKQVSLQEGQREGSLLVQKIYGNYITGLNFREYPLAMDQGQPITLYIKDSASNGCTVTLTLVSINGKVANFIEKTDFTRPCPICLAENTLIDTPSGAITVQNLQKGMPVWTADIFGNKVAATIIKTSKTPVPATHQMIRVILEDGREIFASPGHPIGDGRVFNDLTVGDLLDGSYIITAQKVLYNKGYTYDILPSGDTGFYFANDILIDNTLH